MAELIAKEIAKQHLCYVGQGQIKDAIYRLTLKDWEEDIKQYARQVSKKVAIKIAEQQRIICKNELYNRAKIDDGKDVAELYHKARNAPQPDIDKIINETLK